MATTDFAYDFEADFDDPTNKNAWFGRLVGRGRRVLEVGCATGYVGEHLANHQACTVVGIELVPEAAEKATARGCYERVIVGDVLDPDVLAALGEERFDFVLFGDVLEHLADPVAALRNVSSLLADDGRILICVPNVTHWSIRLRVLFGHFDYTTTGILDRTHLRFFTKSTATTLVQNAGLDVRATSGVVWLPGPLRKLPVGAQDRLKAIAGRLRPNFFYGQILLDAAPAAHPVRAVA